MAGAVGDEGDEVEIGVFGAAEQAIDGAHHEAYDVDVAPFVEPAYIIGVGDGSFVIDEVDGASVVHHIEPVAYVFAFAIDGEGAAVADVVDEQRDELLGELVGAVIVRAVADERRHAVGVVVGAHEMVARGFRGRVGRMGTIGSGFEEEVVAVGGGVAGAGDVEGAIHFVGGDVVEALALIAFGKRLPIVARRLQETEGAHHIGAGERHRIFDGTIDVTFGGEVDDAVDVFLFEQTTHGGVVADVETGELIVRRVFHVGEIGQVAGVGEHVEADDVVVGIFANKTAYDVVADETGAAGDDDGVHSVGCWG